MRRGESVVADGCVVSVAAHGGSVAASGGSAASGGERVAGDGGNEAVYVAGRQWQCGGRQCVMCEYTSCSPEILVDPV